MCRKQRSKRYRDTPSYLLTEAAARTITVNPFIITTDPQLDDDLASSTWTPQLPDGLDPFPLLQN